MRGTRTLPLALSLERTSADVPLFLRVARALSDAIARGQLAAGTRLPGTRTLAEALGVHRNTVLAAYRELHAQGWVTSRAGADTRVVDELPPSLDPATRARGHAPTRAASKTLGFVLPRDRDPRAGAHARLRDDDELYPRGVLALDGGLPDVRLAPLDALGRSVRRVLRDAGPALLRYGDPLGDPAARASIARFLAQTRGIAADPSQIALTSGSQQALFLSAHALLEPGSRVAIEHPGYRPAWQALRHAGARLVPLAVDPEGVSIEALTRALARGPVRAVYLTPQHQYPTTVTLSAARRLALLSLAHAHRFAVVEDDYDHEYHYEGRPVLPLAQRDEQGSVVYVGTLSKVLAPSLRLGWVYGPPAFIARVRSIRQLVDRQVDPLVARAVSLLVDDGTLLRHMRKMRAVYRARRDLLVRELHARLGDALACAPPTGGMALWLSWRDPRVSSEKWRELALAQRVAVQSAPRFYLRSIAPGSSRDRHLRVGFAVANERELTRAARVLAETFERAHRAGRAAEAP